MENKKEKIIIRVLALLLIVALGVIAVLFKEVKDKDNKSNDSKKAQNSENVVAKKIINTDYFKVILDENGNVYLSVIEGNDAGDDLLAKKFDKAPNYNFNYKEVKLLKLDLQNIRDVQNLHYAQGNGCYIVFFDQNYKVYALNEYVVIDTGDLTPLTDDSLNDVFNIYSDCSDDGCDVYAETTVNGKIKKVSFYDLFEKKENEKEKKEEKQPETKKQEYINDKKYSIKEVLYDSISYGNDTVEKVELSKDGVVLVSLTGSDYADAGDDEETEFNIKRKEVATDVVKTYTFNVGKSDICEGNKRIIFVHKDNTASFIDIDDLVCGHKIVVKKLDGISNIDKFEDKVTKTKGEPDGHQIYVITKDGKKTDITDKLLEEDIED